MEINIEKLLKEAYDKTIEREQKRNLSKEDKVAKELLDEIEREEDEENTKNMSESEIKEYFIKKEQRNKRKKELEYKIQNQNKRIVPSVLKINFRNNDLIDEVKSILSNNGLGEFEKVDTILYYHSIDTDIAQKEANFLMSIINEYNDLLIKELDGKENWLEIYNKYNSLGTKYITSDYHNTTIEKLKKSLIKSDETIAYEKGKKVALKQAQLETDEMSRKYWMDFIESNYTGLGNRNNIEGIVNKIFNYLKSNTKNTYFFDTDLELSYILRTLESKDDIYYKENLKTDFETYFEIKGIYDNLTSLNDSKPAEKYNHKQFNENYKYIQNEIMGEYFETIKVKDDFTKFEGIDFEYNMRGANYFLHPSTLEHRYIKTGKDIIETMANEIVAYHKDINHIKFSVNLKERLKEESKYVTKENPLYKKIVQIHKESHPMYNELNNKKHNTKEKTNITAQKRK